ncbi:MAG: cupin domain-containing protein [Thermoleophilia bacterium]
MVDYSVTEVADVPDSAAVVLDMFLQRGAERVTDPAHVQYRFLTELLGLTSFAISVERFAPGFRPSRGHRHSLQEEVYLVISGQIEMKLDDDVIRVGPMTAVRVPPHTGRAIRCSGGEEATIVVVGAPRTGLDDVEFLAGFWTD